MRVSTGKDMSGFLICLILIAVCVIGKYLMVAEVRRLEGVVRSKQQRFFEAGGRVKVAQQKLLIAQKSEGLAARKISTLKYRLQGLESQMAEVEIQEVEEQLVKQREIGAVLDKVVRTALRQAGLENETQVRRLMGAISSLIDLEKAGSGEDLVAAIRQKLTELKEGKAGDLAEHPEGAPARAGEKEEPAGVEGEGSDQKEGPTAAEILQEKPEEHSPAGGDRGSPEQVLASTRKGPDSQTHPAAPREGG